MKTLFGLLPGLALLLAACSPAVALPTSAPQTLAAPTTTPALTEQAATAVLATAVAATPAATIGGPVVITVLPANGSPQPGVTPAPAPTATPIPTLKSGLSPTELKYHLLAAFPNLFFCDPDYYPVARADEAALAEQRFPELQANQEEFQAILSHNNLAGVASFSSDQKLLIYREHKKLAALRFELMGDKYQFQLQIKDSNGKGQLITGLIDGSGAVSAQQSQPSFATCPICLAAGTLIDTPRGPVAVANLKPGDPVWTVDASGTRVSAVILRTGHVPAPATHQMVHVTLADGRELWASPGHPTADGRTLGELVAGERLDGARIVQVERVLYGQPATYDLLPAGATGFYWANGILIASTLK
jgi:hypothetical protein